MKVLPTCLDRNRMNSSGDHQPSTHDMTTLALEIRKTRPVVQLTYHPTGADI